MSRQQRSKTKIRKRLDRTLKSIKRIHKLYYDFAEHFIFSRSASLDVERYGDKAQFADAVLMWAKKHPDVLVTGCDDTSFSSSDIVLIPHQVKGRNPQYMGTSVIVLPQIDHQVPFQFFLYPSHAQSLQKCLEKLAKFY